MSTDFYKMLSSLRLNIFLLLLLFFPAATSMAYDNICETDESPLTEICEWEDFETDEFKISSNSFPTNSTRYDDIIDSFDAWEDVVGAPINIRYASSSNSDGVFDIGDGVSEVGFVDESEMGSSADTDSEGNALAIAFTNLSWNTSYGNFIQATDILLNADEDWAYGLPDYLATRYYPNQGSSEHYMSGSLRIVAIHEIGHALGLGHTNDYGAMLELATGAVHPGSNPFMPLPDDRQGLREYYPGSSSETDMGVSNFYEDSNEMLDDVDLSYANVGDPDWESEDRIFCPGDTFEVTKTILNNGTASSTMDGQYYLSENETISTNDILIRSTTITVGAETDYTNTITLTIPSTVNYSRNYEVGFILDPQNTVSETNGTNNTMLFSYIRIDTEEVCNPQRKIKNVYTKIKPDAVYFAKQLKAGVSGIFEINVKNVVSKKSSDGNAIYSYIDTVVQRTFLGTSPKNGLLQIRQIGGAIGNEQEGEALIVSGAPQIKAGDRLIVFLGANGKSIIPFVGGTTGILRVVQDQTHGLIVTNYAGFPFINYDKEKHFFSVRPDYLKKIQAQQSSNKETDKAGMSITVQKDFSSLQAPPMSYEQFSQAFVSFISSTGQYQPIVYVKTEPTSTFKETTDFSTINIADEK